MKKLDENLDTKAPSLSGVFNEVKLDANTTKAWDMTRTALLWDCPAFTHILYSMMKRGNDIAIFTDDPRIPTAGTDGRNLIINPEFFFKLPLQQRVFICAHEIMHAIFDHCAQGYMFRQRGKVVTPAGKSYEYNDRIMNIAMDLVINDALIEAKVGQFVPCGVHDRAFGTSKDSIVDVYEKVYKDDKGGGKGPGGGGQSGFDAHLSPGQGQGKDPQNVISGRSDIEWNTALAAGLAQAKLQGKLPESLERLLGQMMEPVVSWQEKIQAFFARKVGSGSYDWRRPDRQLIVRDIYAPGRSGFGAGAVVVAVDTSGSIGQPELDRFFGEMVGILSDVRPRIMYVVWCDAKVHKVDEVTEAEEISGLKAIGGGGTDFNPVFQWIESKGLEPDALVYLTDGYGSFPPSAPNYPVLWGDIMCGKGVKYPWGDVVEVPIKAT